MEKQYLSSGAVLSYVLVLISLFSSLASALSLQLSLESSLFSAIPSSPVASLALCFINMFGILLVELIAVMSSFNCHVGFLVARMGQQYVPALPVLGIILVRAEAS